MSSFLRPDEMASDSQIRRNIEHNQSAKKGVKTAAGIASSVAGLGLASKGVGLASKLAPFLNDLIPMDLAIKGINKFSPEIGNILKKGQSMGLDLKEGLNFIKGKLEPQQTQSTNNKNIISQYSDELNAFLENHINQGRAPLEAGALAQLDPKFKKVIKKMEEDHKTNFSSILQSTYGQQAQPQQSAPQAQQPMQQQMPQQTQQPGGLNPQLLQAMNGIRTAMQNLSGTP